MFNTHSLSLSTTLYLFVVCCCREWYHPTSVLLSPAHSQRLIITLYDLSEVDFDLPSDGIDLNETWPSFVLLVLSPFFSLILIHVCACVCVCVRKSFQSGDARRSLFRSPAASKEAIAASKPSPDHV